MVLETDPPPTTDFPSSFDSDVPPSDDSFTPKDIRASYAIDFSRLHRSPFLSTSRLEAAISRRISVAAEHLSRLPTQEEVDALAYHTARGLALASYGYPFGIVAGAYRCWETRASYKYPFIRNAEGGRPGTVFTIGSRAFMLSPAFVHTARLSLYCFLGGLISSMVFDGYALSRAAVGQYKDPRLKELKRKIEEEAKKERGMVEGRRGKQKRSVAGSQGDDASPSAGADGEFVDVGMERRLYRDNDGQVGGALPSSMTVEQPAPRKMVQVRGPRRTEEESETGSPDPFYDGDYDDASPAAMDRPSRTARGTTGGGSAWDRLRREAASGESNTTGRSRPSPGESRKEDSYSYSSEEAERQLAKDKAQKEFDAQLERERQGGDFGGSTGGRRW